jgi:type I restriction enzyme S subunit
MTASRPTKTLAWNRVTLGDVAIVVSGLVDPRVEPFASLPHIAPDGIESGTGRLLHFAPAHDLGLISGKYEFMPGDVLYSKIRPNLNKVTRAPFRGTCSADMYVLRGVPTKVLNDYLCFALRSGDFVTQALSYANRTGIPKINKAQLNSIGLTLPPLPEQRRIAEVLDKADALRAKRSAALAQLKTLTQSIFLDMFGDPVSNTRAWSLQRIADYVADFQGGQSFQPEDSSATTLRRVLKISAVTSGRFLPGESKPVTDSHHPAPMHFVKEGDLLISRANTSELVGAVALVDACPPNLLLPDKLWRFVWRQPKTVDPLFARALFQSPQMRREISQNASGTGGSMKNISKAKLRRVETIVPPFDLQRQFAERVDLVETATRAHRASLVALDALFASLQHRAFRGEL